MVNQKAAQKALRSEMMVAPTAGSMVASMAEKWELQWVVASVDLTAALWADLRVSQMAALTADMLEGRLVVLMAQR